MVNIREYAAVFIIAAALMGIANISWAIEAGPIDISQKKEQSEAVTVFTPIITGVQDSEVEFNLNQILTGDVQRGLDKFLLRWNQTPKTNQLVVKPKFFADYSEKFNRNGILSITIQQYSYIDKLPTEKCINAYTIDLNTGKIYNLFQIFRPGVNFNSRLYDIIKKESAVRHIKCSIKQIKDTQPFYLTEEGLVIFFLAYEISPKQADVIRFVIPYDMIKDILNPELTV